ncbi:FtsK/SpoIIIE domain-containing protein [Buchananella felis]|uniref:FtsK/SpoIIIE domain-containing protein n=1 Tax=Buchananella felis TaxID=3231492 RepID=UPI0035282585
MRLKLELVSTDGIRPVMVTAEANTTICDVASTIRSGQTSLYIPADNSLTLELLSDENSAIAVLPPRSLVTEAALRSGQRVRLTQWAETGSSSGSSVPARLRVISGPDAGAVFPLRPGPNVIGRSDDCDVVINDRQISRRHARIVVGAQVEIIDMHSANGLVLADERVEQAVLGPRTTVLAGATTFIVERAAAADSPALVETSFNRSPQVRVRYKGREFAAPEAPKKQGARKFPLIAMVAPLLMGTILFAVSRNIMSIIFVGLSPLIAVGTYLDAKITAKKARKADEERFEEDIAALEKDLTQALVEEHLHRRDEIPTLDSVIEAGFSLSPRLWHRRPADSDYLTVNLGMGRALSRNKLTLPSRKDADAATWARITDLAEKVKFVDDVPITAPFSEARNLGLAGREEWRLPVARGLVAQLTCLHSPAELVLCAIASADSSDAWQYLMWLPHVGSPYSPLGGSHLAAGPAAVSALVSALEELVDARRKAKASFPTVVLLVEDDAPVERGRLVSLAKDGPDAGVHLLWMADAQAKLPADCRIFLAHEDDGSVTAGFVDQEYNAPISRVEPLTEVMAGNLARQLSPIEDAGAPVIDQSGIPRAVSYLALAGTELASSPQVTVERWQENGSVLTRAAQGPRRAANLRALVGQGPQGEFTLDLKGQGPHALVGGTSGAGKSEFLQSWILGMAAAHSPQRVTFLFVDYKGGSAFADCVRLPHSVGLVTDLSPHLVRRALTSLRAELQYREHLLNLKNAKDLAALERTGDPECPPSLVIVVDEFAALVQEVPEFVDGVVDVAQRGRSLGLHLILATQRPAGVIKGNLRANTALRIALRMADESDSVDVIDSPLAAEFDPRIPGRAAVRTGPGRISLFQAGYAGGRTVAEAGPGRIDIETMTFGSGIPWDIPRPQQHDAEDESTPTDISRVVTAISGAADLCGIPAPRKPWLPELGTHYDLAELGRTFGASSSSERLLFGIVDDPAHQSQHPVFYKPDEDGNLAVFGAGGSGKSAVLRSLAFAAAATSPEARTEIYGIDFSTAGLSMLEGLPVVGSIIDGSDLERIGRLMRKLVDVMEQRSARFAAARVGSIAEYRQATGSTDEARILLLIDGFGAFRTEFELNASPNSVFALFSRLLSEGRAVGIHVMVTAERHGVLPSSLSAHLPTRLVLRQADQNSYASLDVPRDVLDDAPPGRAVLAGQDNELQVAVPGGSSLPAKQARAIDALAEELRVRGVAPAQPIARMDTQVHRSQVPDSVEGLPVLGIEESTLAAMPFTGQGAMMIAGMPGSGRTSALESITQSMHRWAPAAEFFFIGPRRSRVHALPLWAATAHDPEEAVELAARLKPLAEAPAQNEALPDVVLVIESLGELVSTPAETPVLDVIKKLRRNGHFVLAEQETSAWASGWQLIAEVRNTRHGIVMQPNPMDGDLLFKVDLPRVKRSDYPLGRGVYVRSGKMWTVQLPMPESGRPS